MAKWFSKESRPNFRSPNGKAQNGIKSNSVIKKIEYSLNIKFLDLEINTQNHCIGKYNHGTSPAS